MIAKHGNTYFATGARVYGLAAGGYTNCVMNSKDAVPARANWKSIDGGLGITTKHSEPNGDYTRLLPRERIPWFDGNGDIGSSTMPTVPRNWHLYICSTTPSRKLFRRAIP